MPIVARQHSPCRGLPLAKRGGPTNWKLQRNGRIAILALMTTAATTTPAATDAEIAASIDTGRKQLLSRMFGRMDRGEMALATLAIAKSGPLPDDPKFVECVAELVRSTSGATYQPFRTGGVDNYEAAVVLMALVALDSKRYRSNIETMANYLMGKQTPDGAWDYHNGSTGDTSMTQYGVLALWEASAVGVAVPPGVWARAATWLMSRQDVDGGFTYHPSIPTAPGRSKQGDIRHTMSAAGVGSLLICRSRLKLRAGPKNLVEAEVEIPTEFDLLIPVEEGAVPLPLRGKDTLKRDADSGPDVSSNELNEAIELGMRWLNEHFTIDQLMGPGHICYYLYGVERLATFAEANQLGSVDWYQAGADYLIAHQTQSGVWTVSYPDVVDTSFAILFLSRSTLKSIRRIEIVLLKEGMAVGGRGIPTEEEASGDEISRKRARYQRALRTPIDDILESLAKGQDIFDEGAAAAIETADPKELIKKFGSNQKILGRLARHKQAEVREAALWAIVKLDDLRLAPILIEALTDPEPNVYRAANEGLETLSRKIGGVGLPDDPPKAAELKKGVAAWQKWYGELRVETEPEQRFDDGL